MVDDMSSLNKAADDAFFPFLELPPELMLRVCDFLDSSIVINVLGNVCTYLHQLVNDNLIWRTRIRNRWPGRKYPPGTETLMFDWKEACMSREREFKIWKDSSEHMFDTNIEISHACIDAVHINQQRGLLVLGCRDHRILSYNLDNIPMQSKLTFKDVQTANLFVKEHNGWVWTVNSTLDRICSGGWDSKLKIWDLKGEELSFYKCSSPVICSYMDNDEVLVGTMLGTLAKVDTRTESLVSKKRLSKKAILCMQATPQWLITGHESRIIHILDRKQMIVCNTARCKTGYPKTMNLINNLLYVGCRDGTVELYEFDHQLGSLTFLETIQEGDDRMMEVRKVVATLGSVITANKDGTCKIWEPSSTPQLMTNISLGAEICDMTYVGGKLAVGLSTGTVNLYRAFRQEQSANIC